MSVNSVSAVAYAAPGATSVYAGLTSTSHSALVPAGAVAAGAGVPWEGEPVPAPLCRSVKSDGTACGASPAGESDFCVGHLRGVVARLVRL